MFAAVLRRAVNVSGGSGAAMSARFDLSLLLPFVHIAGHAAVTRTQRMASTSLYHCALVWSDPETVLPTVSSYSATFQSCTSWRRRIVYSAKLYGQTR